MSQPIEAQPEQTPLTPDQLFLNIVRQQRDHGTSMANDTIAQMQVNLEMQQREIKAKDARIAELGKIIADSDLHIAELKARLMPSCAATTELTEEMVRAYAPSNVVAMAGEK